MKTKKRTFFTLFAALFGAMCFTACGGSHETFKGKLSDESFETENAALTVTWSRRPCFLHGRRLHVSLLYPFM